MYRLEKRYIKDKKKEKYRKKGKKYRVGMRNNFPSLFEVYGERSRKIKKKRKRNDKLIKRFDIELINISEKIKELLASKNHK